MARVAEDYLTLGERNSRYELNLSDAADAACPHIQNEILSSVISDGDYASVEGAWTGASGDSNSIVFADFQEGGALYESTCQ